MRFPIARRFILITAVCTSSLFSIMIAAPAQAVVDTTQLEGDIVYLTNKQRELHGCKAVHIDARLAAAAAAHSAYMARKGVLNHTGANGASFISRDQAARYPHPLAENIAFDYRTGVDVVKAWLDSPPHRANLLNCDATTIGVGVTLAADGTPYIVQDFGA
jgi:uncharacterized protein YkwD